MPNSYSSAVRFVGYDYLASIPSTIGGVLPLTVAGWIRLSQAPLGAPQVIFSNTHSDGVSGTSLQIDAEGVLSGGYYFQEGGGSTSGMTIAKTPIADDYWHYVAMTISATGDIALYIDGLTADPENASAAEAGDAARPVGAFLNPGSHAVPGLIEFVSWSVWSSVLTPKELVPPEFEEPSPSSPEESGLQIAISFADGAAIDTSGKNVPVTSSGPIQWTTPSLQLSASGLATADQRHPIQIGASGAFSLMAWVRPAASGALTLFSAVNGDQKVTVVVGKDGITVNRGGASGGGAELNYPGHLAADWLHIAAVIQSEEILLYINGEQRASLAVPGMSSWALAYSSLASTISMPPYSATAGVQSLSVWNVCLSADEIEMYMSGHEPLPDSGAVASFPLFENPIDQISGGALSLLNAEITGDQGLDTNVQPTQPTTRTPFDARYGPSMTDEPRIFTAAERKRAAERFAAAIPDDPDGALLPEALRPALADFETHLKDRPGDEAQRLRRDYIRTLHLGHAQQEAGDLTGHFTLEPCEGGTAFVFHDWDGPKIVHRSATVFTPIQSAALTVAVDVVSLIFAVFGVVAAARAVAQATDSWLGPIVDSIVWAISWVKGYDVQNVGMFFRFVYLSGRFVSLMRACITGMSFWSILFTALSFAAQLVLMFASGGLALAMKITILGVSTAKLISDIKTLVDLKNQSRPEGAIAA